MANIGDTLQKLGSKLEDVYGILAAVTEVISQLDAAVGGNTTRQKLEEINQMIDDASSVNINRGSLQSQVDSKFDQPPAEPPAEPPAA